MTTIIKPKKATNKTQNRGGKREGAGRPSDGIKRRTWQLWLSEHEYSLVLQLVAKIRGNIN